MYQISFEKAIDITQLTRLYEANNWSSAKKPELLQKAMLNSHSVVSVWNGEELIGLGNAISDGALVVYFPHLLVMLGYQGKGIGTMIMGEMKNIYSEFHMQMLTADKDASMFYQKMGFEKAGDTIPMWKYEGDEH